MTPEDRHLSSEEEDDLMGDIDWGELQEFFLDHLRDQLEDMEQQLRAGDATALARIGHSIKGSGGGVGYPRFSELGRDLEEAGKLADLAASRLACMALRGEFLVYRPQDAVLLQDLFTGPGEGLRAA